MTDIKALKVSEVLKHPQLTIHNGRLTCLANGDTEVNFTESKLEGKPVVIMPVETLKDICAELDELTFLRSLTISA